MENWQLSNGELSMSKFIFLVFFNTVYIFVLHIYIIIFSISLINRYKPRQPYIIYQVIKMLMSIHWGHECTFLFARY